MNDLIIKGAKLADTIRAATKYDQAVGTLTLSNEERKALAAYLDAVDSRWYSLGTLPDDRTTVLLADITGDVFAGYRSEEVWYNSAGRYVTPTIYAWRHLPVCPREEELK